MIDPRTAMAIPFGITFSGLAVFGLYNGWQADRAAKAGSVQKEKRYKSGASSALVIAGVNIVLLAITVF